ncbi:MAG: SAM-dependent methyltransferase [Clostridia bacterium]|nr:SAM-dependent methyltransferase [Clostridia bacterium]
MRLDERLSLAYDLYETCALAADIGTDHGYLPLALLSGGKCERMILTDVSPDALNNARGHFALSGLEDRADLRLGDGLTPLTEECGMISVLGMGGKTIRDILLRGRDRIRGARLLLSAHTDLPEVRSAVAELGYHLTKEEPCRAAGRYYLIMKAEPGAESLTEEEIRRGKRVTESESPALAGYLAHRLKAEEAQLRGLRAAPRAEPSALARAEADAAFYRSALKAAEGRRAGKTGQKD